jgi:hypothetical protein
LFYAEIIAFNNLEEPLKKIYYALLNNANEFKSFFHYTGYKESLDETKAFQWLFKFPSYEFRSYNDIPLQQMAVKATYR